MHMMGNQKVPRVLVSHCNGRTYGNVQARTHTLAPSTLPLLEASAGGFFWTLPEFGRRIRCYVLYGRGTCPLEGHFQSREQPKVTRGEIRRMRWLGDDTTSDVWLGAETTGPACHLSRRFLCTTCTVTLCSGGNNSRCTKPSMSIPGTF
jgi:hypothetical protein